MCGGPSRTWSAAVDADPPGSTNGWVLAIPLHRLGSTLPVHRYTAPRHIPPRTGTASTLLMRLLTALAVPHRSSSHMTVLDPYKEILGVNNALHHGNTALFHG